jgi:hypothetical protein
MGGRKNSAVRATGGRVSKAGSKSKEEKMTRVGGGLGAPGLCAE